jgi:hypothetical protein
MANGLKKSKDDIIQEDVQVSEEVLAEVVKAKAPKDSYALPELKEKDKVQEPGHTTRAFRA